MSCNLVHMFNKTKSGILRSLVVLYKWSYQKRHLKTENRSLKIINFNRSKAVTRQTHKISPVTKHYHYHNVAFFLHVKWIRRKKWCLRLSKDKFIFALAKLGAKLFYDLPRPLSSANNFRQPLKTIIIIDVFCAWSSIFSSSLILASFKSKHHIFYWKVSYFILVFLLIVFPNQNISRGCTDHSYGDHSSVPGVFPEVIGYIWVIVGWYINRLIGQSIVGCMITGNWID